MYKTLEVLSGSALLTVVIACIVCGYILHMWHVLKDIANEDARKQADRLFNSYVKNCEYKVHTQLVITDEMGGKND
jgi:hypothetical protein